MMHRMPKNILIQLLIQNTVLGCPFCAIEMRRGYGAKLMAQGLRTTGELDNAALGQATLLLTHKWGSWDAEATVRFPSNTPHNVL